MTSACLHRNCDLRFADFTFLSQLSGGAQGFTNLRRGKDGKIYCFKCVSNPNSVAERNLFLRGLRSPFLVDLLHCFVHEGRLYICMEYCSGGSLQDLMNSRVDLTMDDIWFMFTQLVHGLFYLHTNSVVHRDVKPGNIVLTSTTPPYRVKYCDFGISKQLHNTLARSVFGTPSYMSPEIASPYSQGLLQTLPYTNAVDVWSLGVVLYHLVEKRLPFQSVNDILNGQIPRSNSEFGDVIAQMLVRDASRRITSQQLMNLPRIKQVAALFDNYDDPLLLKYQISLLKKDNLNQAGLITSLTSRVSQLNSKLSRQSGLIQTLKNNNTTLTSKISEVETRLSQALSQMSRLQELESLLPLVSQLSSMGLGGSQNSEEHNGLQQASTSSQKIIQVDGNLFSGFTSVEALSNDRIANHFSMRDQRGNMVFGELILFSGNSSYCATVTNFMSKSLTSPFIASPNYALKNDKGLLLVMEYCAGGSLFDFIEVKKQKLSNTDIWLIITQLVHALVLLHRNGIIHCDVKPGTVFLCSEERPLRVKLGDFSICIDLNDSPVFEVRGTPLFMAPEVLQGGCYDTAVDMWSLGVLIYFLVHGSYPFESFNETLSAEIPTSDSEFGHLIRKLLLRDPTQRATAEELLRYPKIAETYNRYCRVFTRGRLN
ncbi:hypothetical protein RCL1_001346 [Eukaryota sp. TZLM3-RCL]